MNITRKKRIKLMAEVQCWPLWAMDEDNNIDPATLPISDQLVNDLNLWSEKFDSIYKLDDPNFHMFPICFSDEQEEDAFYNEGWSLMRRLSSELPEVEFWYRDKRHKTILQEPPSE